MTVSLLTTCRAAHEKSGLRMVPHEKYTVEEHGNGLLLDSYRMENVPF